MNEASEFFYEFYNAGDKIHEMLRFSISDSAAGKGGYVADDRAGVGYWPLQAPKESWFQVPTEIESGNESVRVDFRRDILRRLGERGVCVLDPRHDPATEDPDKPLSYYPIASTREAVEARGKELWMQYTRKIVEQHLNDCQSAMAAGGAPMSAKGFTKHCLALHGVTDPGERYFLGLKNGQQPANGNGISPDVQAILASMQAQQQTLMTCLLAIASGEKIDPELLKSLAQPVQTSAALAAPLTSGIATGEIKKPVGDKPDGWTPPPAQGRRGRAEAAQKAL